jgi:replicative DNA helicase
MYDRGNLLYRASVVMVAGMPAAYKSMFVLNLVHTMKARTLYISADSDASVQISRLSAMITKQPSNRIRTALDEAPAYYETVLAQSEVQFSFDSNPDAYDIESEINAWVELYDEYPEVIVVDNLRNVFSGADNEHGGYKVIQQRLIDIARETGACVITMHHMKEGGEGKYKRSSTWPAPRSGVDGMVNQLPDFILSVAREGNIFRMAVVKDRNGPDDPEVIAPPVELRVDMQTASFYPYDSMQQRLSQIEAENNWSPTDILERT